MMWSRVRIDIGWRDLLFGLVATLMPSDPKRVQDQLESEWTGEQADAIACLSVRTAFDLLLRAWKFPIGSEVLFSAITVPDMPRIAEAHGLVPVPIDLNDQYRIDIDALNAAWTPQAKAIVVAHLFGDRGDLSKVVAFAKEKNLKVIEDCAQAWCSPVYRGDEHGDVRLFSFGPIKTATALGGALCRISDPELLADMRRIQQSDPFRSRFSYGCKLIKYAVLKILTFRPCYSVFLAVQRLLGRTPDEAVNKLTRGFGQSDIPGMFRFRPCGPLLQLLRRRLRTYNVKRVLRRNVIGNFVMKEAASESAPTCLPKDHAYWLIPYRTDRPAELIQHLRVNGFDATTRGRLEVVASPADRPELKCQTAHRLLSETVLLPCYFELPDREVQRLASLLIATHEREFASDQ